MSGWKSEISLCTMPMPRAARTVIPKDENRPTSAAAKRRDHGDRQHGRVQGDDRGQQDRGQSRQPAGDGEVQELDAVRRPPGGRRDPTVLGDRRGRQPEQGAGVHEPQHGGAGQGDADEQQSVEPDGQVAPERDDPRREHRPGLHDADSPSQDHERLAGAEQAERGDELGELGGVAQRRQHGVREQAEEHPDHETEGQRPPGGIAVVAEVVAEEGGDAAKRAGAEVQDAGGPVDEDDPEGDERGERAGRHPEQHEPQAPPR